MSAQVNDRFLRLEALITSYLVESVDVPLSLQVWSEGQLRVLVPYLNGGRTPETMAENEVLVTCSESGGSGLPGAPTGAASSETIHIEDSGEVEPPAYRVRRTPDGPWEEATAEEVAEFTAHDAAVAEEERSREAADRLALHQHEAAMAQRWDDWAIRTEMNRTNLPPSRKRVRITMCAGTSSGQAIGEAHIEGVIPRSEQATISFSVAETMLGGLAHAAGQEASHADPQLAPYERQHLPALAEPVQDFLSSMEGRHWLWRFTQQLATSEEVQERFGMDVAEAFQLWAAMQADLEAEVKNVADRLLDNDEASASEESTIAVEVPGEDAHSLGVQVWQGSNRSRRRTWKRWNSLVW